MRYPHYWPDEHPTDPRIFVPNIEFYITNVCNLTCKDCNRFNDHNFTGWQPWSEYESLYTDWSKKIRLQRVTILGGEPLLNPTICDWVAGINRLWQKRVQILTNGTRLNQTEGLYDVMSTFNNWIGISVHNINDLEKHFEEVKKFLKGPLKFWKGRENNANTWGADYAFEDSNGVHVHLWIQNDFYKSSVEVNNQGKLSLYNSDPKEAHNECGFAQCQCYHFIRGKLYKCGPVALMPEFDNQFHLDISPEDRELLNSYKPLEVNEFDSRGQQFIDTIDDVIPQCKFCPSHRTQNVIIESLNKVKNATSSFNIR